MAIGYLDSSYLSNIADAIRSKDGSQNTYTPSQMPQAIMDIPSGSVEDPAVRFFDFDGTIIEELTDQELASLTELPTAPNHSTDEIPLTFDEWNWTLAEIKAFRTANPTWAVNVGALYHTTDNKVHLIYDVPINGWSAYLGTFLNPAEVDWGDGTTETITGYKSHTYTKGRYHCIYTSNAGDRITLSSNGALNNQFYLTKIGLPLHSQTSLSTGSTFPNLVSISVPSDSQGFDLMTADYLRWISVTKLFTGTMRYPRGIEYASITYTSNIGTVEFQNCGKLEEFFVPDTVSIGYNGFVYSRHLKRVRVGSVQTSIGNFAQTGIEEIILQEGITSLLAGVFNGCTNLHKIELPSTLTQINTNAFNSCYALKEIVIPPSVTSIGNSAFANDIVTVTMKSTTPPTLGTNCFNVNSDIIIVPYSADHSVLTAYQTANNWSNYASIMVEAEPTT